MLGPKSDFMRHSGRAQFGGIPGRASSFCGPRVFCSLILCLLPLVLAFRLEAQEVDFDVSHRVIRQGKTLTCSNETVAGALPVIGWVWDFGDGGTSADEAPNHVYGAPGQFTVSLTAITASDNVTETKVGYVIVLGPGAPVIINEYLASNGSGLQDEDGKYSDWIELYNATDDPVSLLGWALTDDELNPSKWLLPDVTIGPGGFLVVFASDKNRSAVPGELHTNFKLDADGEYVALVQDPSVPTVAYAYPAREQRTDVSYGLVGMDTGLPEPELHGFMVVPTPGAPNAYDSAQADVTAAPVLSHIHGHYDAPFNLSLTATDPGAEIYYTEDGSLPNQVTGTLYAVPLPVTANRVIRAIAYAPGYIGSRVVTATYIIGASALEKSLPALCVVGDPAKDLWAPDGIMVINGGYYDDSGKWQPLNSGDFNSFLEHGDEWERKVSLEFFDPSGAPASSELLGFQEDCGIRVHGSTGRREGYRIAAAIDDPWDDYVYKISFRYYFRDEYGNSRLLYPLIPNANLYSLKHIVMRAGTDDPYNPFVKDEMSRRLMAQMGNVTCMGTFVHFYLNGYFKGYYNPVERYSEDFFQHAYGSNTGWDVVKGTDEAEYDRRELVEGDWGAWFALNDFAENNDLSDPTNYAAIATMMDIDNFIDYLIIECYGANFDWPRNNWYMARERSADAGLSRWRFYVWDMEMCYYAMSDSAEDFTVEPYSDNPFHLTDGWSFLRAPGTNRDDSPIAKLYQALRENDDFRAAWEARACVLLGPGGVLGTANAQVLFDDLYNEVNDVLLYQPMNTFIRDVWAVERPRWLLHWFAEEGLMPTYGNTDTDADGLTGVEEIALGTNPDNPDSDGDGLTDGEEVNLLLTDPLDSDSDDDLLPDGWEVDYGLNPNSGAGDDGASGDPDLDTYSNLDEYNAGTDPRSGESFPGNSVPAADFSATPTSGCAPLSVQFTDQSSGSPTSWLWSFGDGTTSSEQNPSHDYAECGLYAVTLTVQNAYGSDTETRTDYIVVTCGDLVANRSFWYYKYASPGVEEVRVTIENLGADDLSALEVVEELPAGWTFDSLVSFDPAGCGPATIPSLGATGTLEFIWICIPESPYTLTYRVNVPSGQTGEVPFSGDVHYQGAGGAEQTAPIGCLGSVAERVQHSLDYSPANYTISVSEILRVIQFYNLGGYHCAVGTEDGYEPGLSEALDPCCVPHDSDYNPKDWKISVSEILRVIQFYNLGGYHLAEGTEDGYAPGLAAKAMPNSVKADEKMVLPPAVTLPALYAVRGTAANGDASEVTVTFTGVGAEPVSALGLVETLPEGWTFDSIVDATEPPAVAPVQGDSGELNFAWIWPPALPAQVTYRIHSDSAKAGMAELVGKALYRTSGAEQQAVVAHGAPQTFHADASASPLWQGLPTQPLFRPPGLQNRLDAEYASTDEQSGFVSRRFLR